MEGCVQERILVGKCDELRSTHAHLAEIAVKLRCLLSTSGATNGVGGGEDGSGGGGGDGCEGEGGEVQGGECEVAVQPRGVTRGGSEAGQSQEIDLRQLLAKREAELAHAQTELAYLRAAMACAVTGDGVADTSVVSPVADRASGQNDLDFPLAVPVFDIATPHTTGKSHAWDGEVGVFDAARDDSTQAFCDGRIEVLETRSALEGRFDCEGGRQQWIIERRSEQPANLQRMRVAREEEPYDCQASGASVVGMSPAGDSSASTSAARASGSFSVASTSSADTLVGASQHNERGCVAAPVTASTRNAVSNTVWLQDGVLQPSFSAAILEPLGPDGVVPPEAAATPHAAVVGVTSASCDGELDAWGDVAEPPGSAAGSAAGLGLLWRPPPPSGSTSASTSVACTPSLTPASATRQFSMRTRGDGSFVLCVGEGLPAPSPSTFSRASRSRSPSALEGLRLLEDDGGEAEEEEVEAEEEAEETRAPPPPVVPWLAPSAAPAPAASAAPAVEMHVATSIRRPSPVSWRPSPVSLRPSQEPPCSREAAAVVARAVEAARACTLEHLAKLAASSNVAASPPRSRGAPSPPSRGPPPPSCGAAKLGGGASGGASSGASGCASSGASGGPSGGASSDAFGDSSATAAAALAAAGVGYECQRLEAHLSRAVLNRQRVVGRVRQNLDELEELVVQVAAGGSHLTRSAYLGAMSSRAMSSPLWPHPPRPYAYAASPARVTAASASTRALAPGLRRAAPSSAASLTGLACWPPPPLDRDRHHCGGAAAAAVAAAPAALAAPAPGGAWPLLGAPAWPMGGLLPRPLAVASSGTHGRLRQARHARSLSPQPEVRATSSGEYGCCGPPELRRQASEPRIRPTRDRGYLGLKSALAAGGLFAPARPLASAWPCGIRPASPPLPLRPTAAYAAMAAAPRYA